MHLDIQKANMWKRISAGLLDLILLSVEVAFLAMLLSSLLGFDRYNDALDDCYRKYEAAYGISFDITMDDYNAMTQEQIDHCHWVLEDPKNRKSPYMMLGSKGYVVQLQYEEETAKLPNNDVDMPLQVMRIGDVWFYINPYEVYHQYAQPLKEATPSGKWLMSEMANTEGSYIPTPELMDTDIYPAWLCGGSWLGGEAGNKMIAKLIEMAEELK